MWDAWGGDAGFTWSRKIVEANKSVWEGVFFKEIVTPDEENWFDTATVDEPQSN